MAEENGMRLRRRPRLGWIDGVKVALGSMWMTVEAARQCAKDRKEMIEFHAATFAWFLPPPHTLVAYHSERGCIPLHDAVMVNCKYAQLLNIKTQVLGKWAKGCMLGKCVFVF